MRESDDSHLPLSRLSSRFPATTLVGVVSGLVLSPAVSLAEDAFEEGGGEAKDSTWAREISINLASERLASSEIGAGTEGEA